MLFHDEDTYHDNNYALSITNIGSDETKVIKAIRRFVSANSLSSKKKKALMGRIKLWEKNADGIANFGKSVWSSQKKYKEWNKKSLTSKMEYINEQRREMIPQFGKNEIKLALHAGYVWKESLFFSKEYRQSFFDIGCYSNGKSYSNSLGYSVPSYSSMSIQIIKAKLEEIKRPKIGTKCFSPEIFNDYHLFSYRRSYEKFKNIRYRNSYAENEISKKDLEEIKINGLEKYYQKHPIVFCSFPQKTSVIKFKNQLEKSGATVRVIDKNKIANTFTRMREQAKKDCVKSGRNWNKLKQEQQDLFDNSSWLYEDLLARKNFKVGDTISFTNLSQLMLSDLKSFATGGGSLTTNYSYFNKRKLLGVLTKRNPKRAKVNITVSILACDLDDPETKKYISERFVDNLQISYRYLSHTTKHEKLLLAVDKLARQKSL